MLVRRYNKLWGLAIMNNEATTDDILQLRTKIKIFTWNFEIMVLRSFIEIPAFL